MKDLIERLEKATRPNGALDVEIYQAVVDPLSVPFKQYGGRVWSGMGPASVAVKCYTASVDAALTLVPEGWHGFVGIGRGNEHAILYFKGGGLHAAPDIEFEAGAHSHAIALCIAALKAREALAHPTKTEGE